MTMLMDRFDRVKDEHNRTAYLVPCGSCSRTTRIVANFGMAPEMVAKKARQKGWEVDKHGTAACPVCCEIRNKHKLKPPKPKEPVMAKPDPTPTVAVIPPREPTQTDKRRIFRAIDDVWDELKARYTGVNTDQSIADKLNVPRAWVATARIEAFGDAMRNEAAERALTELKDLRRNAGEAMQRAFDAAAVIETQLKIIDLTIAKLEKLA